MRATSSLYTICIMGEFGIWEIASGLGARSLYYFSLLFFGLKIFTSPFMFSSTLDWLSRAEDMVVSIGVVFGWSG